MVAVYVLQAHVTLHYSCVCSELYWIQLLLAHAWTLLYCQHYATCNAVMKFQYMNGLSYTHNNDLLNALLECIKFYLYIHIVFLLFYPSDIIYSTFY